MVNVPTTRWVTQSLGILCQIRMSCTSEGEQAGLFRVLCGGMWAMFNVCVTCKPQEGIKNIKNLSRNDSEILSEIHDSQTSAPDVNGVVLNGGSVAIRRGTWSQVVSLQAVPMVCTI